MKEFIISISAVSVIISALKLLCPADKEERLIKFALGMFFIISIIGGAANIKAELPQTETTLGQEYGENIKLASLEASVVSLLEENDIKISEIYFDTDISAEKSISINKVILKTQKKEDGPKAEGIVKSQTGLEVELK